MELLPLHLQICQGPLVSQGIWGDNKPSLCKYFAYPLSTLFSPGNVLQSWHCTFIEIQY